MHSDSRVSITRFVKTLIGLQRVSQLVTPVVTIHEPRGGIAQWCMLESQEVLRMSFLSYSDLSCGILTQPDEQVSITRTTVPL